MYKVKLLRKVKWHIKDESDSLCKKKNKYS